MTTIRFGDKTYNLPGSRVARIAIGCSLIVGGILGFLPILGFWMIPLGLLILSIDLPAVRRRRRKWVVELGAWLKRKNPNLAERMGFTNSNGVGPVRNRRRQDAAQGKDN